MSCKLTKSLACVVLVLLTAGGDPPPFGEAVSRSVTVTNEALIPPTFAESISRSFTVTNEALNPPAFSESISRSFTVTNEALNPPTFSESISRSVTVTNEALNPPTFAESISRSFTVTNEALNPPTFAESISRSFTVCNAAGDPPPDEDEDGVSDCFDQCPGSPDGEDCDDDGIPDGCETDCDGNGVPDDCDIADCMGDPACDDCDADGILDICEIPPIGSGEADCNDNGIPDQCDIANCPPGELTCNDCNLNGVPDFCDDPTDSVPDECVEWDGEAENDDFWNTAQNWLDDAVPGDEDPAFEESVVIEGSKTNVILDIDVSIDSLLLGSGATLHIDRENLPGDMIVESGGAILVEGSLLVASDREIDASGSSVTIGPGGVYQADPEAAGAVSATLNAGSVSILEGPMAAGGGGVMSLIEDMQLIVEGNLTLDGSNATGGLAPGGDGDCTPPDWNTHDNAFVSVAGDIDMSGGVASEHASSEPLILGGDFNNHSIVMVPQIFDWSTGALTMDGTLQSIEAAGKDWGPWPIGLIANFALGTLTLTAGGVVEVVDTFDNQQDGVVACDEALYVDVLEVPEGATLLTDGCRVYYNTLVGGGFVSDLDVLQIQEPAAADLNGDGQVGALDLATLLGSWGSCGDCKNCPADLNGDCQVGPDDLAQLLGSWGP